MNIIKIGNKKNLLHKKEILETTKSEQIWKKALTKNEIIDLLNNLKTEIMNHDFFNDDNFIMNERRNSLKKIILERLESEENPEECIKESLFNLWEFIQDEYDGNIQLIAKKMNIASYTIQKKYEKYRKKAIICFQEKEIILEIINKLESYIENNIQ